MKMVQKALVLMCTIFVVLALSCASSGGSKGGGDLQEITGLAWTWETSDDSAAPNNGSSTITMTDAAEGYNFKGQITNKYQYGFACIQVIPADEATLAALRKAKSFSFKVKGDGLRYAVKMPTSNISDYCYYETVFGTEEGQAIDVNIQVKQLVQPTWGNYKSFQQSSVDFLEFQTTHNGKPGPFDLTLWDVKLYE